MKLIKKLVGDDFDFIRDREVVFRVPVRRRKTEIPGLPVGLLPGKGTFGAEILTEASFHKGKLSKRHSF